MTEDENVFAPLCASEDIEPGKESVFKVNGRDVLVCRSIEGELFAVEDICPHANACLSGGRFRNGFYACPHHDVDRHKNRF